jgi:hypothetical protein
MSDAGSSDKPMRPLLISIPADMNPAAVTIVRQFAEAMANGLYEVQLVDSHHDVKLILEPAVTA